MTAAAGWNRTSTGGTGWCSRASCILIPVRCSPLPAVALRAVLLPGQQLQVAQRGLATLGHGLDMVDLEVQLVPAALAAPGAEEVSVAVPESGEHRVAELLPDLGEAAANLF